MLNYNVLNDFVEKLKSAGITPNDLKELVNLYKEGDIQLTLTAGDNISIDDNVISATDTTYTAGTNVTITDGVISATDTTYTAGTNVTITDGVISATDTTYTAGTGIDITDGVISASGGSTQYTHLIRINGSHLGWTIDLIFQIQSNTSTPFTKQTLCQYLSNNRVSNCYFIANGYYISSGTNTKGNIEGVQGYASVSTTSLRIIEYDRDTGAENSYSVDISDTDYAFYTQVL